MNKTASYALRAASCRAGRGTAIATALTLCALAHAAHASQLLAAETSLIVGTQSQLLSLIAPGAGEVEVTLADLGWPTKLASLSFSATTDSSVLKSVSLPQSFSTYETSFSLTGPGAFYAHISGEAQGLGIPGLPGIGLYSLQIGFTPQGVPVPLPASAWLLIIGLCAMLGVVGIAKSNPATADPLPAPGR